jgi:hypothetical protein
MGKVYLNNSKYKRKIWKKNIETVFKFKAHTPQENYANLLYSFNNWLHGAESFLRS